MITAEQATSEQVLKRYKPLAGPFRRCEEGIYHRMLAYLRGTGARVTTMADADGVVICRLRSECETLEETRARLDRATAPKH